MIRSGCVHVLREREEDAATASTTTLGTPYGSGGRGHHSYRRRVTLERKVGMVSCRLLLSTPNKNGATWCCGLEKLVATSYRTLSHAMTVDQDHSFEGATHSGKRSSSFSL